MRDLTDLMTEERVIDTDYGPYRLKYCFHRTREGRWTYYGVSVAQYGRNGEEERLRDREVIPAFSEDYQETQDFWEMLIREEVFPVHLFSIADDWNYPEDL